MDESRPPSPGPQPTTPSRQAEPGWQPLANLRNDMDRLFEGFWRSLGAPRGGDAPPRLFQGAFGPASPSLDLVENTADYRLSAELPGMDAADVELTIADDMLSLRGEKKETREEKTETFHLSERRFGSFMRSIPLPRGVDRDRIEARFDKGVLTVVLPKTAEASAAKTRIDIKPGP